MAFGLLHFSHFSARIPSNGVNRSRRIGLNGIRCDFPSIGPELAPRPLHWEMQGVALERETWISKEERGLSVDDLSPLLLWRSLRYGNKIKLACLFSVGRAFW